MSVGRTFGLQASWDEVIRNIAPADLAGAQLRNAIDAADSMNRQIEEFINRYVVRSTTDGDTVTFDTAGTYVFDGDVTLTGDLTLDGGVIQTSATGARVVLTEDGSGGALGLSLPSLLIYTGAEDAPGQIQAVTVSTTHTLYAYAPADDTGGDANPAYWSLSSSGTGQVGIGTAGGPSIIWGDRYAAVYQGTAGAPGLAIQGDLNTGIYGKAADELGFSAGGGLRGWFTTSSFNLAAGTVPAENDATIGSGNRQRLYYRNTDGAIIRRSTAGL